MPKQMTAKCFTVDGYSSQNKVQPQKVPKQPWRLKMFNLLILLKVFPISFKAANSPQFKAFSWPTLVNFFVYVFLLTILPPVVNNYIFSCTVLGKSPAREGLFTTDNMVQGINLILYTMTSTLLIWISKGVPKFWNLIISSDQEYPAGKSLVPKICLNVLLQVVAQIMTFVFVFKRVITVNIIESQVLYGVIIVAVCVSAITFFFCITITNFYVTVWTEKLAGLCQSWQKYPWEDPIEKTEKLMRYYAGCSEGLGPFYFVKFLLLQTFLIVNMYLTMTYIIANSFHHGDVFFYIGGYFLFGLCVLWELLLMSNAAANCLKAARSMAEPLRRKKFKLLETRNDTKEISYIEDLIKRVECLSPFTGNEFFNVESQTVTSIVGSTVTYLIVLIQFKISEKNDEK